MRWILYCLFLEAACFSCKPQGPNLPLVGTKWTMDMMEKIEVKLRDPSSALHLTLHPDTSLVDGQAGCNTFTGIYTHGADSLLLFENLRATYLNCPDLDYEIRFFRTLDSTRSYLIKYNRLILMDRNGKKIAAFHASLPITPDNPSRP